LSRIPHCRGRCQFPMLVCGVIDLEGKFMTNRNEAR
jgi:hypothetical protein